MVGVYEDRLPPVLNAALALGCVATVLPTARRRNLRDTFALGDLAGRPVVQYDYFTRSALKHVMVYHSSDMARGRAIYALHVPAGGGVRVVQEG